MLRLLPTTNTNFAISGLFITVPPLSRVHVLNTLPVPPTIHISYPQIFSRNKHQPTYSHSIHSVEHILYALCCLNMMHQVRIILLYGTILIRSSFYTTFRTR